MVGLLVVVWIVVVVITVVWTVVGWTVEVVDMIIVVSDVDVVGWGLEVVRTIIGDSVVEDVVPRVVAWKFLVLWEVGVVEAIMVVTVTVIVV